VVANAGVGNWGRFWELTDRQWRDVIDINLTGVFNTLKAAAPILIEQGDGGSIVVVSSVAGLKAVPGQAHYAASKHAITGLTKNAAIELAPFGIRVNSLHPWGIDTAMGSDSWAMPLIVANPSYAASYAQILTEPRACQPEDIAAAGAWLASDEARTVTGTQLSVDHGATKV
jgi:NAD(P)-dependent dehydrogenase (short-subunit alcohol dehydrogenase family)